MKMKNRFYIKMPANFFQTPKIAALTAMERANNKSYFKTYMQILLMSIENHGLLMLDTEREIPMTPELLAGFMGETVESITETLSVLETLGLVEMQQNGGIYVIDAQTLSGENNTKTVETGTEYELTSAESEQFCEAWNSLPEKVPACRSIKPTTRRGYKLAKLLEMYGMDEILAAVQNVQESEFLQQMHGFTVDWFLAENNFIKILEGNYANREPEKQSGVLI